MRVRICNFPDCKNRYRRSGLCDSHLKQKQRGKPLTPLRSRNDKPRESKTCRECGEEKTLTEFHTNRRGYRIADCRDCELVALHEKES